MREIPLNIETQADTQKILRPFCFFLFVFSTSERFGIERLCSWLNGIAYW